MVTGDDMLPRRLPEFGYDAVWKLNHTLRFDCGVPVQELPPEKSEFYDVSLGTWCDGGCKFCYVGATRDGTHCPDPVETWKKLSTHWSTWTDPIEGDKVTDRPFCIAIGSTGEPTGHPQFSEFLEAVWQSGVIPSYTTSGKLLGYSGSSQEKNKRITKILEATEKYALAVAVSLGNRDLAEYAYRAISRLTEIKINIATHHIISDAASIDEFFNVRETLGTKIHTYTLLPLVKQGRASSGMSDGAWEYLEQELLRRKEGGEWIGNVSFGAKFIPYIEKSGNKLGVSLSPEGAYSKNMILSGDRVILTPSSFDLRPCRVIEL